MMKNPCHECTDRTITCHGVCRRYEEWKKENEKKKKWLNEQKHEPSDGCLKGQRQRIKDGRSRRKWNVKTRNGGDGRW